MNRDSSDEHARGPPSTEDFLSSFILEPRATPIDPGGRQSPRAFDDRGRLFEGAVSTEKDDYAFRDDHIYAEGTLMQRVTSDQHQEQARPNFARGNTQQVEESSNAFLNGK